MDDTWLADIRLAAGDDVEARHIADVFATRPAFIGPQFDQPETPLLLPSEIAALSLKRRCLILTTDSATPSMRGLALLHATAHAVYVAEDMSNILGGQTDSVAYTRASMLVARVFNAHCGNCFSQVEPPTALWPREAPQSQREADARDELWRLTRLRFTRFSEEETLGDWLSRMRLAQGTIGR